MKKLALLSIFLALPVFGENVLYDGDGTPLADAAVTQALLEKIQALEVRMQATEDVSTCRVKAMAGAGADLLSTSAALKFNSAAREANPIGLNVEARIGLKLMMIAATEVNCSKAPPGMRKWLARLALAAQSAMVANNAIVSIKGNK